MTQRIFISGFEIGVWIGIVYLLYAICRDLRNAYLR
jgi:hypothetical protein